MKYFLFNHSGCLNHGCEAIIRGTVNIIDNYDKNAEYVICSHDSESDGIISDIKSFQFKMRSLNGFEKFISYANLKIRHSETYAIRKMLLPVIKQAEECDVCLSVGGDTYCYGDNSVIQVMTEELKKTGKRVVLWGMSIGEEDLTEDKLKNLQVFDAVYARESLTYNLLKKYNANDNVFLYADPAFCMEREETELPDGYTKENTLGINISHLIERYNPEIKQYVKDFIKYVLDNTTLKVLLVPHVVENGNNDYEYMIPVYDEFKKTGRIEILPSDLNAKQYKSCISKLRFFIGARTHATIAAYSSGIPTFVLGYSVKSHGIATDLFGDNRYVLNVQEIDGAKHLTDALNTLIKDETQIKENLMIKIPMQIRNAMQMGAELVNDMR